MTSIRRAQSILALTTLLAGGALAEEAAPAPMGARADRLGALVLPASGLRIVVPRADRDRVEAFGRYGVPTTGGAPELSDELGVRLPPDGAAMPPDGLALSVQVVADCNELARLEGVARDVSPCERPLRDGEKPDRRCAAVHRWDRVTQGPVGDGLVAAVWCGSGLLVHTVRPAEPGPEPEATRRLAAWLDALADAMALPPASALTPSQLLLDRGDEAEATRTLPITQSFYLLSARRELTTLHPALRQDELPDGRPCTAAPDAPFDADDPLSAPTEPPGYPGAIAAADCFALPLPTRVAQRARVTARAEGCPEGLGRPAVWPKERRWPVALSDGAGGPILAATRWSEAVVEVCVPLSGGDSLRVTLSPEPVAFSGGPVPRAATAQAARLAALPILRFDAALPFLRELARAAR